LLIEYAWRPMLYAQILAVLALMFGLPLVGPVDAPVDPLATEPAVAGRAVRLAYALAVIGFAAIAGGSIARRLTPAARVIVRSRLRGPGGVAAIIGLTAAALALGLLPLADHEADVRWLSVFAALTFSALGVSTLLGLVLPFAGTLHRAVAAGPEGPLDSNRRLVRALPVVLLAMDVIAVVMARRRDPLVVVVPVTGALLAASLGTVAMLAVLAHPRIVTPRVIAYAFLGLASVAAVAPGWLPFGRTHGFTVPIIGAACATVALVLARLVRQPRS
jgi:hypothetical protein